MWSTSGDDDYDYYYIPGWEKYETTGKLEDKKVEIKNVGSGFFLQCEKQLEMIMIIIMMIDGTQKIKNKAEIDKKMLK